MRKRKKPARRRRTPARRRLRIAAPGAASAPPPPPPLVAAATQVEQRGLPIVAALARVARGAGAPRARLESAMRILFAAYGASDPDFSGLFLTGWARARHDKQFRLTLAWQREQILLQAATEGGAVTGERLVRSLLTLAVSGPVSGA